MSNEDMPAGETGGGSGTPVGQELASLPERVRVHALARLIGKSSRQVLDALSRLGETVRSPQSSVPKPLAIQVAEELDETKSDAQAENALPAGAAAETETDREPGQEATPAESPTGTPEQDTSQEAQPEQQAESERPARRAALTPIFAAPEAVYREPAPADTDDEPQAEQDTGESEGEEGDEDGSRRRRRRGRRGRGRGKGGQNDEAGDSQDGEPGQEAKQDKPAEKSQDKGGQEKGKPDKEQDEEEAAADEASGDSEGGDGEGSSRRRRRRRRRKPGSEEDSTGDDDPPNTVTHVRDTKHDSGRDEVRSVRGSTRLEAKRQRRRDGRDAGRRRVPILSEAEFLARRESVDRKMVVRESGDQVQIGVLEDDVLVEHFVTSSGSGSLVGNVYLGRVQNVLPSMEAAFVDIGRGRNAVLYAGEVDWDSAGLEGKARKIEQALSTGDSVLVQVTKDPVGHKGARLTTQISLPGRFLVYVPGGGATGISRKLPDTERKRLKDILKRVVPSDAGVIVRTASEGIAEEELGRDVRRLQAQWEVIKERSEQKSAKAPQLLYEEPDLLIKVVRDMFTEDFTSLVVSGGEAWDTIDAYVQHVAPDLAGRLKRHTSNNDVFSEYRIDEQITKALDRKVWLPSGGYLVIDRTEAMTVIDVNTGKFTGSGGNLEETVTRNNLEAAEEIVRQLRLRDIGGIVVIDFIDMVLESNRDLVLRRLTECLGRDRTRHQVAEVTSLGLVQMTRKRVGTGLIEAFSQPCEHCRGRGVLISTEPVHQHQAGGNSGGQQGKGKRKGNGNTGDNGRQFGAAQHDDEARKAVERIAAATSASTAAEQPAEPEPVAAAQPAAETSVETAAVQTTEAAQVSETPAEPVAAAETAGTTGETAEQAEVAQDETPPDVPVETVAETPSEQADEAEAAGDSGPETTEATESAEAAEAAETTSAFHQPWAAPSEPRPMNGRVAGEPETPATPDATTGSPGSRRPRRAASRPAGPPENTPV